MVHLNLTDEQAELVARAREPIEICDAHGRLLGVFTPKAGAPRQQPQSKPETAYDLANQLGILGSVPDAPPDLSTNPRYLEGLGRD